MTEPPGGHEDTLPWEPRETLPPPDETVVTPGLPSTTSPTPSPSETGRLIGRQFGPYQVREEIASGGQGVPEGHRSPREIIQERSELPQLFLFSAE